jgi:hypothetical protein
MMDGCCRFLGRRITMLFSLPSSRCVHFEPFVPIPFVCLLVFFCCFREGDWYQRFLTLSSVCKQALLLYLLRCVSDHNICLEGFFAKFCC